MWCLTSRESLEVLATDSVDGQSRCKEETSILTIRDQIRLTGDLSEPFPITNGMKHGCVLDLTLQRDAQACNT